MKELYTLDETLEKIEKELTVWDYLTIDNDSFYYAYEENNVFLSSFHKSKLTSSSQSLNFMGNILIKLSRFAHIMSSRPGTEEVTFYALLNTPQKSIVGKKVDEKMLSIAAPPLVWRREIIKEAIHKRVEFNIKNDQTFIFLDIGCGAGMDSLEIERLIHRTVELTGDPHYYESYLNLNIDIDEKWLRNNETLVKLMFNNNNNTIRLNTSAFDFLEEKNYQYILEMYDNLIISCNGFAEFLTDHDLRILYQEIEELVRSFKGQALLILPFANKNKKHETIGRKIGFQFRAKSKDEMLMLITEIFKNYQVTYKEDHSQIVMFVEKIL